MAWLCVYHKKAVLFSDFQLNMRYSSLNEEYTQSLQVVIGTVGFRKSALKKYLSLLNCNQSGSTDDSQSVDSARLEIERGSTAAALMTRDQLRMRRASAFPGMMLKSCPATTSGDENNSGGRGSLGRNGTRNQTIPRDCRLDAGNGGIRQRGSAGALLEGNGRRGSAELVKANFSQTKDHNKGLKQKKQKGSHDSTRTSEHNHKLRGLDEQRSHRLVVDGKSGRPHRGSWSEPRARNSAIQEDEDETSSVGDEDSSQTSSPD